METALDSSEGRSWGRRGAGIPAVSLGLADSPPPLVDWTREGEAHEGTEEPFGYGGESAPSFLPLTRVRADTEPEGQGAPYPMDTPAWEDYGGRGETLRWPGISGWRQEGSSSSSSGLGAATGQAAGSGPPLAGAGPTPSTQRLADLALLGETRRQAVRFLGRGEARPPW